MWNKLTYVLLFIFLGVGIFTSINTKDPILMIPVVIVFASGLNFAVGIDKSSETLKGIQKVVDDYDKENPGWREEMKAFEKKHGIVRKTTLK
jgi:hypothetical protein